MKCSSNHVNAAGQKFCGECGECLPNAVEGPLPVDGTGLGELLASSESSAHDPADVAHAAATVAVPTRSYPLDGATGDNLTDCTASASWWAQNWKKIAVPWGVIVTITGLLSIAAPSGATRAMFSISVAPFGCALLLGLPVLLFWNLAHDVRPGGSLTLDAREQRRDVRRANYERTVTSRNAARVVAGVTCPSCRHQRAERITIAKKAGAAGAFGVLSAGYASKTFKCQNCGYKW
jgi:hypothetical protein